MAILCKQLRVNNRLHCTGQSIKYDTHANYHEKGREYTASHCARRQIAKADGGNRLGSDVQAVKYRPAFHQVKRDCSQHQRRQDRHQNDADASPSREKETRKG